jgi:hypothetical protein
MIALVMFIVGLILLSVSGPLARFLALEDIVGRFAGIIGVLVVISGVVLGLQVWFWISNLVVQRRRLVQRARAAIANLANLSVEEQEVIRYCVQRSQRTIFARGTADIRALVAKGLLEVVGGETLGRVKTACSIPELVWRHLTMNCLNAQGELEFPTGTARREAISPPVIRQPDPALLADTLVLGGQAKL